MWNVACSVVAIGRILVTPSHVLRHPTPHPDYHPLLFNQNKARYCYEWGFADGIKAMDLKEIFLGFPDGPSVITLSLIHI